MPTFIYQTRHIRNLIAVAVTFVRSCEKWRDHPRPNLEIWLATTIVSVRNNSHRSQILIDQPETCQVAQDSKSLAMSESYENILRVEEVKPAEAVILIESSNVEVDSTRPGLKNTVTSTTLIGGAGSSADPRVVNLQRIDNDKFSYRNPKVSQPSLDGKHITTYSLEDSIFIVALWNTKLELVTAFQIELGGFRAYDNNIIDVQVSNNGEYIVLSCYPSSPLLYNPASPFFDGLSFDKYGLPYKDNECLLVAISVSEARIMVGLDGAKGPVALSTDNELFTCDGKYISIYRNVGNAFKLFRQCELSILPLTRPIVDVSLQIREMFHGVGSGYLTWAETDSVSILDLKAFPPKVCSICFLTGNNVVDNSCPAFSKIETAFSPDRRIMAMYSVNVSKSSLRSMSIYFVESGLLCIEFDVSSLGNIWRHKFVDNNHIVTFSRKSKSSSSKEWQVKLWDIFAGVAIREQTVTCEDPNAILDIQGDGRIIYLEDGVLNFIPLFTDPIYDETTDEELLLVKELDGVSARKETDGTYSLYLRSGQKRHSVALEHWMVPPNKDAGDLWMVQENAAYKNAAYVRGTFLDKSRNRNEQRLLVVTAHSVYVYWVDALVVVLSNTFWKPQYIHIFPETRDRKGWEITSAAIRRQKGATDDSPCQLIYKDNFGEIRTLEIPGHSEAYTPRIAYDCIQTIDVFKDMTKSDMFLMDTSTITFVCYNLLEQFLKTRPTVFNRPVLSSAGNPNPYKSVLSTLIRSTEKLNPLILSIIEKKTYIPSFEDFPKNTESILSVAIDCQRTDITRVLLKYFVAETKTRHLMGWMTTVVKAMDKLQEFSPAILRECMRDITYFLAMYNTTTRPNLLITELLPEADGQTAKSHLEAVVPKGMTLHSTKMTTKKHSQSVISRGARLESTNRKANNNLSRLCIVPLPGFMTYTHPSGHDKWWDRFSMLYVRPRSPFSTAALQEAADVFTEPVMEVVILFKWRTFARYYYYGIFAIHIIFYLLYAFAVTLPNLPLIAIQALMTIVAVLSCIFLVHEMRQIIGEGLEDYLKSPYNYFDLATYVLPLASAILFLNGNDLPTDLATWTVLVLWIHMIMELRFIRSFGEFIQIVIEIVKSIMSFLMLLGLLIFAFAHSLHILLDNTETPEGSTNEYIWIDSSLGSVFDFLGGDYSSVAAWDGNRSLKVITMIFFLLVSIIMLNILIALMADTYGVNREKGRAAWLLQMAALVAEIEVYWLLPYHRENTEWFPNYLFYVASVKEIAEYKKVEDDEKLMEITRKLELRENELKELMKKLSVLMENPSDKT